MPYELVTLNHIYKLATLLILEYIAISDQKLMRSTKSYYEILGIKSDSTDEEIRTAYRKTIRRYHPDLNPDKRKYGKRTRQLNVALEVLTNPTLRKRYDEKLERIGKAEANKEFETDDRTEPGAHEKTEFEKEDRYESKLNKNTSGSAEVPLEPMFNFYPPRNTKGLLRRLLVNLIVCVFATLLCLAIWYLILSQIRSENFDFNAVNRVDDGKRSATTSPQVSIDKSSNNVHFNESEKNQIEKLALNPNPKMIDSNANFLPPSLIPNIEKSGSYPLLSDVQDSLEKTTEAPEAPFTEDRFAKLKEAARLGLSKTENGDLALQSLKLLHEAKIENNPSLAKQIAELALICARQSDDHRLIRQATLAVVSAASMKPLEREKNNE